MTSCVPNAGRRGGLGCTERSQGTPSGRANELGVRRGRSCNPRHPPEHARSQVVNEVKALLDERLRPALRCALPDERGLLELNFGFDKTLAPDRERLRCL